MMVLSVSDSLQIVYSTTDWMQGWGAVVQAIGAVFAIIAIVCGFRQLNKDSKDKQKQIDNLTALAIESASQTKEMIEANRLQSAHLNKYEEHLEIVKSANQRESEKRESEIRQRKSSIKPEFIISSNKEGLSFTNDGHPRAAETFLIIMNIGEKADIENIEFDDKSMKCDITPFINTIVRKDKRIQFNFLPIQPYDSYKECLIKFRLIYKDCEGNKYYQNVDGKFVGQPKISKPIEILIAEI